MKEKAVQRISVGIILVLIVFLNLLSIRHKTLTTDEPWHYLYGMNILKFEPGVKRFELTAEMPFSCLNAIPRRVGAMLRPLLPEMARDDVLVELAEEPAEKSLNFLYHENAARFMTTLFSVILAFFVFKWGRELYGFSAGFFSLVLYAFSPNIIAHSRLITTDIYAVGMMTISTYYFWIFANEGGWKSGLRSAVVLGVSQLAKYTCLFLYPIFALIVIVRYSREVVDLVRERNFKMLVRYIRTAFTYTILFIVISVAVINAGYLFHQTSVPVSERDFKSDLFRTLQAKASVFSKVPLPLPGPYLQGLDWLIWARSRSSGYSHGVYLLGEFKESDKDFPTFKAYYFYAFLFKVPIAIQVLIVVSLIAYIVNRKEYSFRRNEAFLICPIAFIVIYFNFFVRVPIGIRTFLTAFPFLLVFCGSLLKNWSIFGLWRKSAVVIAVVYLIVSVLSYFPHYISYFNELIWDRTQAYKVLADSNIDWGQNEWYLTQYRKEHPDAVFHPESPVAGRVIVGVNELVLCNRARYRWLRENFEPGNHIAYSYLVFDVPSEAVRNLR